MKYKLCRDGGSVTLIQSALYICAYIRSFAHNHAIWLYYAKHYQLLPMGINQPQVCVYVCVCVCVFIKLHITAQSGPVILVILCHSHSSSQGEINGVACFVGSALGVYARWYKMGAGDLPLLIQVVYTHHFYYFPPR